MPKVLCIADGYKIYNVFVNFGTNYIEVEWTGEHGFGQFLLVKANGELVLDTEFMGRKFCLDIMEYIFNIAKTELEEGKGNERN